MKPVIELIVVEVAVTSGGEVVVRFEMPTDARSGLLELCVAPEQREAFRPGYAYRFEAQEWRESRAAA